MIEKVAGARVRSRSLQLLELGRLTMSSEREGDVHTIGLAGELDLVNAAAVQDELDDAESSDALSIVIDLSRLTFIDSTGVRLVLAAHARAGGAGRLLLLRGSAPVQRVFEICGVDALLPFVD